jgi:hypothetical protein
MQGHGELGNDRKLRCVAYTGTWEMWQETDIEMCTIYRDIGNVVWMWKS